MATEQTPTVDVNDPEAVARNGFRRGYSRDATAQAVQMKLVSRCLAGGPPYCTVGRNDNHAGEANALVARVWAAESAAEGREVSPCDTIPRQSADA